jgi:predicted Rossmann fold flavoprotein
LVSEQTCDIAIIGAGAAGLMAGIWAGRTAKARFQAGEIDRLPRIVILDGAKTLGAKILVAGGGRCNVTHDIVDENAFAGSSRHAIRKVLRRFDVPRTIEFFREIGVELKREETGKLFPVTDRARTVLDALIGAARDAGADLVYTRRVEAVAPESDQTGFQLTSSSADHLRAYRIIFATGGKSLPKTGSDGHGYNIARSLGHSITPRVFAALVPLTLPKNHWICTLSGISAHAMLEVRSGTGKKLHAFTDSMLCTHFGLSGPAILDISRYVADARMDDPATQLIINWLPTYTNESADAALQSLGRISVGRWLRENGLSDRLAKAMCNQCTVDPAAPAHQLARDMRKALAAMITQCPLPITGDRGFAHAEVTAGGIPLGEIRLETMESRICPGLHICGEICDVDGRIGGYNFQWAWASGFVAGTAAAGG